MLPTWIAGRTEHRIALVISLLCASVVIIAVIRFFLIPSSPPTIASTPPQEIKPQVLATSIDLPKEGVPQAMITPIKKPEVEKKELIPPQIINTSAPKAEKTTVSALPHGFYVQVGAFKSSKRAKAMLERLKRWKPRITPRNKHLHAVWIGPFASRNLADKAKKKIAQDNKLRGFIIQHTKL